MTYKYAFEILVLRYQISNIFFGGRGLLKSRYQLPVMN